MTQQPLADQGLLVVEASGSYSDTPHSVGLLWTSDQPYTETSTWQHSSLSLPVLRLYRLTAKQQPSILSTQVTALFTRHDSHTAKKMLSDLDETKVKLFVGV